MQCEVKTTRRPLDEHHHYEQHQYLSLPSILSRILSSTALVRSNAESHPISSTFGPRQCVCSDLTLSHHTAGTSRPHSLPPPITRAPAVSHLPTNPVQHHWAFDTQGQQQQHSLNSSFSFPTIQHPNTSSPPRQTTTPRYLGLRRASRPIRHWPASYIPACNHGVFLPACSYTPATAALQCKRYPKPWLPDIWPQQL